MVATGSGDSYTLDGTKMFVIDGHTANLIVVAARLAGTTRSRTASRSSPSTPMRAGLTRTALATMDQTRKQAKLEFADVAATPLGEPGAGWPALSKTLDQAAAMSSNEMVGGAQKVLDMSVEYAKVRVQFGRPIGSFQAIKHKCADMLLEVESGKSAAYYAAWAAAEDNEELPVAGEPRQGLLLRRVLPRRRREHPDPRWHRLHVGARRAPLLQAGEELRDPARRRHLPPRAPRPAHRDLTPRRSLREPGSRLAPPPHHVHDPSLASLPAMAVLVTLLAVVLALLALLVAGLLRSHAEILRALHQLGVNMDPARTDDEPRCHHPGRRARRPLGRGAEATVALGASTSSAPHPSTTRSASRSSAPST